MKDEKGIYSHRVLGWIFLSFLIFHFSFSFAKNDTIYNGTQIKLDIASPILTPATHQWQKQHYEVAVNVRLAKRWYPTAELGYATNGGFMRLGCDLNPLKKHPESPHALLVGVRCATAVQEGGYTDCWGEIVAGCQVEIYKGEWQTAKGERSMSFYMGWMGRFKCLFTRQERYFNPDYIPGFGNRDKIGWGANYYRGWRF